ARSEENVFGRVLTSLAAGIFDYYPCDGTVFVGYQLFGFGVVKDRDPSGIDLRLDIRVEYPQDRAPTVAAPGIARAAIGLMRCPEDRVLRIDIEPVVHQPVESIRCVQRREPDDILVRS